MYILIKYITFAVIATFINISTQYVIHTLWFHAYSLYIGIFIGTISGFVVKYILDRFYIFHYREKSLRRNTENVLLYGITGVITTFIFWGVELIFNELFDFNMAKYLGAVIGLSIGYFIKYRLDKTYVFKQTA